MLHMQFPLQLSGRAEGSPHKSDVVTRPEAKRWLIAHGGASAR